ncbi:major facilitator superfamily domain-containing protein [Chlamydoabsidia padenii]|nr:major facilitator superfamily domain-containing protein [Chlamydoabsidia padenii]
MPYISPKLLYTFLFACQGSAPVYLTLFYSSQLGLKSDQIGLLVAIAPFISAVACPLWTALADKTKTHNYIMCMIQTLATVAIVSVMGISVVVQNLPDMDSKNRLTVTLVTITSVCFAFFGVPVLPLVDGGVLKILGKNKNQYGRQRMFGSISFGLASSLVGFIADWTKDMNSIFYVYAVSAVFFIMTAGATTFKPESQQTTRFPATAMVSFTTSTTNNNKNDTNPDHTLRRKVQQFHLDPIHDTYNNNTLDDDDEEDYSQIRQNEIQRLIQFATESSIIEAVNLSNPPAYRRSSSYMMDNNDTPPTAPTTLLELLKQRQVFLFFLTMMLMGAALNMVVSFLFIFLTQELGASSSTVGLTGLVGSVTELLFFYYSRDLIRVFGIRFLIILGHVLTIARVFAYTILPKGPTGATIALGLHLLNGIAFSALWGAGVVQADELAPPSLQATSQGILAAMYAGVGAGLGSLLGGVVYEKLGATHMFYVVIGLTSFSLELYLETNTRWGISDLVKWTFLAIMGTYRWIQRARGRQAVPRWSGARGPIHLHDDTSP